MPPQVKKQAVKARSAKAKPKPRPKAKSASKRKPHCTQFNPAFVPLRVTFENESVGILVPKNQLVPAGTLGDVPADVLDMCEKRIRQYFADRDPTDYASLMECVAILFYAGDQRVIREQDELLVLATEPIRQKLADDKSMKANMDRHVIVPIRH